MNAEMKDAPFLGCIADDVTGATDLAGSLVQAGLRTVQVFGVPQDEDLVDIDADAVVIALKSRSIERDSAIRMVLSSLSALKRAGVQRYFFKYCSTFDSVPAGNIGPVAEALMTELGAPQAIFCPAFPENERTVYRGHLFVGDRLLNESGMEHHPLNPMTDADIVRVLGRQTTRTVGLLTWDTVESGGVRAALQSLADSGCELVVADACNDRHLQSIARDITDHVLITGSSGIARWLPDAWRNEGLLRASRTAAQQASVSGRTAILSGSCSEATNRQVDYFRSRYSGFALDVESLFDSPNAAVASIDRSLQAVSDDQPVMVYSTSSPERVTTLQQKYGIDLLAAAIEDALGLVAERLISRYGVRRLILAGGETSGAITKKLGVKAVRIGPEICPGVPWTETIDQNPLGLVLKSGNFGDDAFFETAMQVGT